MKYFIKIVVTLFFGILILPSQAAMATTSALAEQQSRPRLVNLFQREEVQLKLIELGVDSAAAIVRVNNLTGEEVTALHGQVENLPAVAGNHPAAHARVFWPFILILLILGVII